MVSAVTVAAEAVMVMVSGGEGGGGEGGREGGKGGEERDRGGRREIGERRDKHARTRTLASWPDPILLVLTLPNCALENTVCSDWTAFVFSVGMLANQSDYRSG